MPELLIRSLSVTTRAAPHPALTRPAVVLLRMVTAERLYLLPLIRCQFAAKRKQEARIRLFQLRSRLCHIVDLRQDSGLVRLVLAHQRLHPQLSFVHCRPKIYELLAMLQQNGVHRLPLIVSKLQRRYNLRIVPKAALRALEAKRSFERWPMLPESRFRSHSVARSLCQRRSSHHYDSNRNAQSRPPQKTSP